MKFLPTILIFLMLTSSLYAQNSEKAITISPDSTKEEITAYIKSNLEKSATEMEKGNYPVAILYSHRNLELAEKSGDSILLAVSRSYIANNYLKLENVEEARNYINKNINKIKRKRQTF